MLTLVARWRIQWCWCWLLGDNICWQSHLNRPSCAVWSSAGGSRVCRENVWQPALQHRTSSTWRHRSSPAQEAGDAQFLAYLLPPCTSLHCCFSDETVSHRYYKSGFEFLFVHEIAVHCFVSWMVYQMRWWRLILLMLSSTDLMNIGLIKTYFLILTPT